MISIEDIAMVMREIRSHQLDLIQDEQTQKRIHKENIFCSLTIKREMIKRQKKK
jgi:hypothetical protein